MFCALTIKSSNPLLRNLLELQFAHNLHPCFFKCAFGNCKNSLCSLQIIITFWFDLMYSVFE